MNGNPDPEKLFRMLAETGRLIALDDLDDIGDGVINHNTPVPGMSSAPHHWVVGCGLMLLADGGRQMVQQKKLQQINNQDELTIQIIEALEE